jgi:hypothetical protein
MPRTLKPRAGYQRGMNPSYPFEPNLHPPNSIAPRGRCSWRGAEGGGRDVGCEGEAVVSFQDEHGHWQAGCQRALEDLITRGAIQPLGQSA